MLVARFLIMCIAAFAWSCVGAFVMLKGRVYAFGFACIGIYFSVWATFG